LTLRPEPPPPARRPGAPDRGAVPLMEQVRVTNHDLALRAQLVKAHQRMVTGALLFAGLFAILALRLTYATVIHPVLPPPAVLAALRPALDITPPPPGRADLTDRNGTILAVSLPGAQLYADPRQVTEPELAAQKLAGVLPGLDITATAARLSSAKAFVYLDRKLTPDEELAVNGLGIPGVYFQNVESRHYPEGDLAAPTASPASKPISTSACRTTRRRSLCRSTSGSRASSVRNWPRPCRNSNRRAPARSS
jgi:cell division protein FtsI (penicillin-binding protein 3)